jgi:RNA polymerase sigma-70 factor (ECF subfamily)
MVDETRSNEKSPVLGTFATTSSLVLLNRLQQGDVAARDELVRRYWPRLERWARGRLPNAARDLHDTCDLVQETMIAALDRLQDFEPEHDGALLAYLRVAVVNRVRKQVRGMRRRGDKLALDSGIVAPDCDSPLEQVIGRDALERYEKALARLRTEDREAIHLKVELDLPYEDITRALGKPTVTAARMAVSRAIARLVQEMRRHA